MNAVTRAARAGPPEERARPAPTPHRSRWRVGLLGTGYIADWHARALASVRGAVLVSVCDAVVSRARAFGDRLGVPAHGSLEEMLAAERPDVVHVLLPPDHHFPAARALLEAGVHVFVEKPMCARADECEALVDIASTRGLSMGVGHNFLFAEPYERLRRDVRAGLLGPLEHVSITWNKELPQATHGPFEAWMLREPGNVALEIGSHLVTHLLDLCGAPDGLRASASNSVTLPSGVAFHRRWRVEATCGSTAVDLRFSLVPGFEEQSIHVRGLLGSATADLLRNTYVLRRHRPLGDDLDRWAMARAEAREMRSQADGTLAAYVLSRLKLRARGSPYGDSIARALDAFYSGLGRTLDARVSGTTGLAAIRACEEIARAASAPPVLAAAPAAVKATPARAAAPRIVVLGAAGFIGRELVRQLCAAGHAVRVLARSPGKLPPEVRDAVECVRGDLESDSDLHAVMRGATTVYHLARSHVRTWAEYERHEIDVTRRIAEAAMSSGVRRFVYAGTIDSYYAGGRAGVVTEETPLDPKIRRRNLYARAKAESETLLRGLWRERGLPLVVVRPGIVIGRGGSPFHWGVGRWWHGSVCQPWGRGDTPLPLVLVEDVASALVAALDAQGIEGESFNLVADPCLSANDYLAALERHGKFRLQRRPTSIARFWVEDVGKWIVKVLVRHPDRRLPSWRDWETRTQRARFDCSKAKALLGWCPVSDRDEIVRRGIEEPLEELLR